MWIFHLSFNLNYIQTYDIVFWRALYKPCANYFSISFFLLWSLKFNNDIFQSLEISFLWWVRIALSPLSKKNPRLPCLNNWVKCASSFFIRHYWQLLTSGASQVTIIRSGANYQVDSDVRWGSIQAWLTNRVIILESAS